MNDIPPVRMIRPADTSDYRRGIIPVTAETPPGWVSVESAPDSFRDQDEAQAWLSRQMKSVPEGYGLPL